ncbi:hypothetical protein [Streptomyces stelliscabiei]|uniref:hypothetical protein n=1 Tax=Streptomyces stelliscabiei TaxID=146820 RepID=UPI002FF0046E
MTVPQVYMLVVAAFAGAAFCAVKLRQACRTVRDAVDRDRTHDVPPAVVDTGTAPTAPGTTSANSSGTCPLHAPDPELEAGCDRLWDAITEHRKEDNP